MAKIAKAAVLDRPNGTFTIREYKVPNPAPGTFVLRTELCGVCATDAHMYAGGLGGTAYPIILGHEFCGVIDGLGAGVTEDVRGCRSRKATASSSSPAWAAGTATTARSRRRRPCARTSRRTVSWRTTRQNVLGGRLRPVRVLPVPPHPLPEDDAAGGSGRPERAADGRHPRAPQGAAQAGHDRRDPGVRRDRCGRGLLSEERWAPTR